MNTSCVVCKRVIKMMCRLGTKYCSGECEKRDQAGQKP